MAWPLVFAAHAVLAALGFATLGDPQLGIIAFTRDDVDVFAVYRQMYKRGWVAALTTKPRALHLMLSPFHAQVTDTYLADLAASVAAVQAGSNETLTEARYS